MKMFQDEIQQDNSNKKNNIKGKINIEDTSGPKLPMIKIPENFKEPEP